MSAAREEARHDDETVGATAAHVHEGARGTDGPVVVNLPASGDGNAADCLTDSEPGTFVGDQTVAGILETPQDHDVDVRDPDVPGGAVRGPRAVHR